MVVCSVAVAVAVPEWGVHAVVHVTDGLGDQPTSQRHLPVEYGGAGSAADGDDGQSLASRHRRDGLGLYIIKYSMGVCVAFLRQEAGGVWAVGVFEGYRAFRPGSSRCDAFYLVDG